MRKVEKLATVIVLILLAFVYGHVHKTHAIYDRMIENDQYVMMDVSQDQISQEFVCEEETLDGIQVKCQSFGRCIQRKNCLVISLFLILRNFNG